MDAEILRLAHFPPYIILLRHVSPYWSKAVLPSYLRPFLHLVRCLAAFLESASCGTVHLERKTEGNRATRVDQKGTRRIRWKQAGSIKQRLYYDYVDMTLLALRGGVAGAVNYLRPSRNFSHGPLATWRNAAMLVSLKQASLPSRTDEWRSLHHMSTATTAVKPPRQQLDTLGPGRQFWRTNSRNDARAFSTAGVFRSPCSHAVSRAVITRGAALGGSRDVGKLQSARRGFSTGQRRLSPEENDRRKR